VRNGLRRIIFSTITERLYDSITELFNKVQEESIISVVEFSCTHALRDTDTDATRSIYYRALPGK